MKNLPLPLSLIKAYYNNRMLFMLYYYYFQKDGTILNVIIAGRGVGIAEQGSG